MYNLAHDPQEATDIASKHAEIITAAETILRRETVENATFPVRIPNVN